MIQFNSRSITIPLFRVGQPTPDLVATIESARKALAAQR
jgi:hypothetical protein